MGALNSKDLTFRGRVWEYKSLITHDVLDALACVIQVDIRMGKILRILPRSLSPFWLSNKSRFAYEGLSRQRLFFPMMRSSIKDSFIRTQLKFTYKHILNNIVLPIKGIAQNVPDILSLIKFNTFINNFNCNKSKGKISQDNYSQSSLKMVETLIKSNSLIIILLNTDLSVEYPQLSAKLIELTKLGYTIFSFGLPNKSTLYLGDSAVFQKVLHGKHYLSKMLSTVRHWTLFKGYSMRMSDVVIIPDWWTNVTILNLPQTSTQATKHLLNVTDFESICTDSTYTYFLAQSDNIHIYNTKAFVLYIGHHGEKGAQQSHVILPISHIYEELFKNNSSYITNLFGSVINLSQQIANNINFQKTTFNLVQHLKNLIKLSQTNNFITNKKKLVKSFEISNIYIINSQIFEILNEFENLRNLYTFAFRDTEQELNEDLTIIDHITKNTNTFKTSFLEIDSILTLLQSENTTTNFLTVKKFINSTEIKLTQGLSLISNFYQSDIVSRASPALALGALTWQKANEYVDGNF